MTGKNTLKLFILRAVLCLCGLAAVGTIGVLAYGSFFGAPKVSHDVIATAHSPGGHLTAVLTRIGGAGDFGYLVDIDAPDGESERVANFYGVRKNASEAGLDLAWADDHTLELQYQRATVARIDQSDVTMAGARITIMLKPRR